MNRLCAPQGRSALGFNLVFGVVYNSLLTGSRAHAREPVIFQTGTIKL